MPLPVALGVDFPAAWARVLLDGTTPPPAAYPLGVYGRNLLPDLSDLVQNLTPSRLFEFHRALLGQEKHDTLVADDLRPGLAEIGDKIRSVLASLAKRLPGLRTITTALRRRRALNCLRVALKKPQPRIEVVCAGNICRSPYAAYRLAAQPEAVRLSIGSAGTLPRPDRPSPDNGVAEAKAHGIDLTGHRSAHFDIGRAEAANLIVVFDERNLWVLASRYPHLRHRCVLLGDFDGSGPIGDPDGGAPAVFTTCYARIDHALAAFTAALQRNAR
jgi:protein-tyrosine-phosphatase